MQVVFVRCICDSCGKTETVNAVYNEYHDGFEKTLPRDWEFIDNTDFQWINFAGDQCPTCQAYFRRYIEICSRKWKSKRAAKARGMAPGAPQAGAAAKPDHKPEKQAPPRVDDGNQTGMDVV